MPCPECIFVATLHYELFKLWNYLHNTYCWCNFWSNLGIFYPPGAIYRVTPPTVLQLIWKKCHHALHWIYFCGYFVLPNGPNWWVIVILNTFGVIFDQLSPNNTNIWGHFLWHLTPEVPIHREPPTGLQ